MAAPTSHLSTGPQPYWRAPSSLDSVLLSLLLPEKDSSPKAPLESRRPDPSPSLPQNTPSSAADDPMKTRLPEHGPLETPRFWRTLEERIETPEAQRLAHDEFLPGAVPIQGDDGHGLQPQDGFSRRDFFGLVGAAAALAATRGLRSQRPGHHRALHQAPRGGGAGRGQLLRERLPGRAPRLPCAGQDSRRQAHPHHGQ